MQAAKRPCNKAGCNKLSHERFCPDHKDEGSWAPHQRQRKIEHGGKSPYHTKEWRQVRKEVAERARYVCEKCQLRQGNQCDHIINHEDYDGSFTCKRNLQWLCEECHSAKTKKDNAERNRR